MSRTIDVEELELLAINALTQVCEDLKATPSARAQAARTLLEVTKSIGSGAKTKTLETPDPSMLSALELAQCATKVRERKDPFA